MDTYIDPMPITKVAAGILWKDGKFLAARRPDDKPRGGFWEFPGGKQELGESMEQTLRRELKEELDLTVTGPVNTWKVLEHRYTDLRVELHFMQVTEFSGTAFPLDNQELRWLTPEEAKHLPFLPADREILEALEALAQEQADHS